MPNLSRLLENKKALFFGFLFVLIFSFGFFGIKIEIAKADAINDCIAKNCNTATGVVDNYDQCRQNCINAQGAGAAADTGDSCPKNEFPWYKDIVAGLVDLWLWIPKGLAILTGYVLDLATKVMDWPITNSSSSDGAAKAFADGWAQSRDLANMLIVLGFVIVGIATSLRIREYEAKKALWPLIIVALLVNFSGLICGVLIDASNITVKGLLSGGAPTMGTAMVQIARDASVKGICPFATKALGPSLWGYMLASMEFAVIFYALGAGLLLMAFMMIARYAVLGILFMLAPLAFAFWAFPFPKSKELASKWWSHFLKWCFIGVGLAYFLNIAATIMKGFQSSGVLTSDSPITNMAFYFFVVIMVIVVGVYVSAKSSGALGVAVKGLAMGGIGLALGAAGKVASLAANKSGLSRLGNNMKNAAGSAMERVGLRQKGTTAGNAESEISARQKTVGNLTSEQQAKIAGGGAISHDAVQNKVAAIKNLAKAGELHKLGGTKEQAKALAYAESYEKSRGVNSTLRKDAQEHNYELAGENKEGVEEFQHKNGIKDFDVAKKMVNKKQLVSNISKGMSDGELSRINPEHLDYETFRDNFTPNMVNRLETAPGELRKKVGGFQENLHKDMEQAKGANDNAGFSRLRNMHEAAGRVSDNPIYTATVDTPPPQTSQEKFDALFKK